MNSRSLTNVVNDQTVALNALIYGYAGHSLVTPHAAIQQVWWTEERINHKVTRDFVTSHLPAAERQWLTKPVAFGDDLTDDTYLDWILERARRLFLVLTEVGVPERIFAAVNNSWDDDDLPLPMADIKRLHLSMNRRIDSANEKFFHAQFAFLLRELRRGVHADYAPNEQIPLEYVQSLPPAVSLQPWARVHLPKKPNELLVRRKFALGDDQSPQALASAFLLDVETSRLVEHEHIAPVWASYTANGSAYMLTNFVGQHTVKTFIDHRNPPQYQKLPKPQRRRLVLNWMHCLADAVSTLHMNGFCHGAIRPSNVLIDAHNHIAFSDIGSLEFFQRDKRHDASEAYVYGPPEAHADGVVGDQERLFSMTSMSSSGSSTHSRASMRQRLAKSPMKRTGFDFGMSKPKRGPSRRRSDATEKADVFSLGCIFLDLMTFLVKKKAHDFVKHRSSKSKVRTEGRGAKTDASFHANLDRVESWMKTMHDLPLERKDDALRGVPLILNLIRAMLSPMPHLRPTARDVRDRLLDFLQNIAGLDAVHCGAHKHDVGFATSCTSGSDRASSASSANCSSLLSGSDYDTVRSSVTSVGTPWSVAFKRSMTLPESELEDMEAAGALAASPTSAAAVGPTSAPALALAPTSAPVSAPPSALPASPPAVPARCSRRRSLKVVSSPPSLPPPLPLPSPPTSPMSAMTLSSPTSAMALSSPTSATTLSSPTSPASPMSPAPLSELIPNKRERCRSIMPLPFP